MKERGKIFYLTLILLLNGLGLVITLGICQKTWRQTNLVIFIFFFGVIIDL